MILVHDYSVSLECRVFGRRKGEVIWGYMTKESMLRSGRLQKGPSIKKKVKIEWMRIKKGKRGDIWKYGNI